MNNYAQYQFWFNVFQFAFTCVVGFGAWWRTREKADAAKLSSAATAWEKKLTEARAARDESCRQHKAETEKLKSQHNDLQINIGKGPTSADMQRLNDRLSGIEAHINRAPTSDDIKRVHDRLDGMVKLVGGIEGEIKGMSRTLDLLEEHHLKEDR